MHIPNHQEEWYMYVYHSDLSRYVSDGTVGQGDNNNALEKFTN